MIVCIINVLCSFDGNMFCLAILVRKEEQWEQLRSVKFAGLI